MLGNASNPNKADIPERKKSSAVPSVSCGTPKVSGLTRSSRVAPVFSSVWNDPHAGVHAAISCGIKGVSYRALSYWVSDQTLYVSSYSTNIC